MNRFFLRLLLGVAIICMPLSCVSVTFVVGPVVASGFLTSFTVRNESSETVHVTPLGAADNEGTRYHLPLSTSARFLIHATTTADFRLAPSEERTFTYDWDDTEFSEIAVRDERGQWRQLVVNPNPAQRRSPARAPMFVVPPLTELPEAAASVRAAAERQPSSRVTFWRTIGAAGLLPPLLLFYSIKRLRRLRQKTADEAATAPA